ncbi:MAG: hypothetical protein AAFO51_04000 [Pseudomonadota bacterium]
MNKPAWAATLFLALTLSPAAGAQESAMLDVSADLVVAPSSLSITRRSRALGQLNIPNGNLPVDVCQYTFEPDVAVYTVTDSRGSTTFPTISGCDWIVKVENIGFDVQCEPSTRLVGSLSGEVPDITGVEIVPLRPLVRGGSTFGLGEPLTSNCSTGEIEVVPGFIVRLDETASPANGIVLSTFILEAAYE